MTDDELKYWAFLSYSQQDNGGQRPDAQAVSHLCWGDWLHDALKTFSVPAEFVGHLNARGEITPERIHPIFQDTQEQPGDATLGAETRQALEQSRCLVIVCSPRSAQSLHVNEAVRYFKQLGRGRNIFPIVIAGEPNAGDGHQLGASAGDECFVPALRHPLRPDGTLETARRPGKYVVVDARHGADKREILANDHRNAEADLETAKIQLIAVLTGVAFNGLWWREQKRHFVDLADARQQAREALDQVAEGRRQLEEAQRQTRAAQNQVLEKQNLPGDVHAQIQEAQTKAFEAQNQASEARRQLQEFQNKVGDAQAQLEEARSRVLAVEGKCLEAQTQARENQRQAEEAQRQLQESRSQVQVQPTPDETQEVQRQAEESRRLIQELQNQAQQAQAQAQEARVQAEEARRQLQEARSLVPVQPVPVENPEIQRQTEAAHRQIQELLNQNQKAESQAQEARSHAEAAQNQIREAQRQAEESRRQLQAVENRAQEARRQAEEAGRKVQEIQSETQQAQTQIQQARERADEAEGKVQAAQNQIQQARRTSNILALVTLIALLAAGIVWWQRKLAGQVPARPAVDESGEADLAQGEMNHDQILRALQKYGVVRPDADRRQDLDSLAVRIPPEEIPATLTASTNILDDRQRSYFQLAVLGNWMKTNSAAALDWVRQLPDADSRNRALDKIIPALAADSPTNTLVVLNNFKPVPGAESYTLLFQHWATNNPVQAIEQRQQVPGQDSDDTILDAIVTAWADQQPDAALNWVNAQPDSESKNKALETCIHELAKTDAPKALTLAESLPEGTWRSTIIAGLFNDWAARDLDAATAACQQLPDGMARTQAWQSILSRRIAKDPASAAVDVTNLPAGDDRQIALAELCSHWADTDTPAALTWAQSLPSDAEQTAAVNQVVASWAHKDPQAAMQFAGQHPELSGEALSEIAKACSANDLTAATNWVSNLPDGEKKDATLLALSATWAQADPKGMATYALGLPAGDVQTQYLTAACHPLAIRDLPGTVELLKPLSDDGLRQTLLEQAARDCDLSHVDQAAKYIAAMPAGDDQQAAISGLLASWAPADPEAAANWLCAFPTNNLQTAPVQSVIKDWSQTAPAAVAKWLTNSPAGAADEGTVSAFLESTAEKYPEFAGQWTQSVTNEAARQKYQVQVARAWMKTDPSAATNWLNGLDLPAELKQLK